MTTRNADLEMEIAKAPDDPAAYLVYADWLGERGDPRGELITLGIQRAAHPDNAALREREVALHAQHDAEWLGGLAGKDGVSLEWRHGFVHTATIGGRPRGKRWGAVEIDHGETYAQLRSLPVAQLLSAVRFDGYNDDSGEPDWSGATAAIALHGAPPSLVKIDYDRGDYWDISWTHLGSLQPLYGVVPQLRFLRIALGHFELGDIDLPELRHFETYTGGFTQANMAEVLRARWPKLESLILRFGGSEDYGGDCTLEDARPLLEAKLPALRHLAIANAPFTDGFVEALVTSPLLPQLTSLDLSMGALGPEGARTIVDHASAFRHLRSLDVRRSYLDEGSIERLRAIVPHVEASDQEQPDDGYRYCQIGE